MQSRNAFGSSGSPNAKTQPRNSNDAFGDLVGPLSVSSTQANIQKPLNSLPLKSQQQLQTSAGSAPPNQYVNGSIKSNQPAPGNPVIGNGIMNGGKGVAATTNSSSSVSRLTNSSIGSSGPPPLQPNYNSMGLDGLDPFSRLDFQSNVQQQQQASKNSNAAGNEFNSFSQGATRTNPLTPMSSSASKNSFQSMPDHSGQNTLQPLLSVKSTTKTYTNNTQQGFGKRDAFDLLGADMMPPSKSASSSSSMSSASTSLNAMRVNQQINQSLKNEINMSSSSAWDHLDLLASSSKPFTTQTVTSGSTANSNNDPFDIEFLSQMKTTSPPLLDAKPLPAHNEEVLGIFTQSIQPNITTQASVAPNNRDALLQEGVQKLSIMGFDSQVSRKALINANLNMDEAIASLLNGNATPKPALHSLIPDTSPGGGSFAASVAKLEDATKDLMKMGFEYGACKAALLSTGLDKQAAIAILVSETSATAKPPTSFLSEFSTISASRDMSKINQLIQAGFSESECKVALKASGGNLESAMEILLKKSEGNFSGAKNDSTSSRFDPNSLVGAASQIGYSVFQNAKTAFTIAKKKVGDALNEKSGTQLNIVSEKDWTSANFKDSSDDFENKHHLMNGDGEKRPFPSQVHSLNRENSDESIDVPLKRRPKNTPLIESSDAGAVTQTANIQQQDMIGNLVDLDAASNTLMSLSESSPVKHAPANSQSFPQSLRPQEIISIPSIAATDVQLQKSNSYRLSGNEYFKQGRFGDAEAEYTLGIQSLPDGHSDLILLYNNRAACRLKNGDNKGAVADCNYILQKNTKDLKALLRRATAYEALESWENARDDYRKIMLIDPNVKGCSIGLARANNALTKGENVDSSRPTDVKLSEQMRSSVRKAVDEAVQKVRDINEAKEQLDEEKFKVSESVEKMIDLWKSNKETNIRALLSSLEMVLWPECGWKSVTLGDLISPSQVKKRYIQAVSKVHPDKLGPSCTVEQQLIASSVFTVLNKAWDTFKVANNL